MLCYCGDIGVKERIRATLNFFADFHAKFPAVGFQV